MRLNAKTLKKLRKMARRDFNTHLAELKKSVNGWSVKDRCILAFRIIIKRW